MRDGSRAELEPQSVSAAGRRGAVLAQPGLAQPGLTQPGLTQPGLTQPGLTQPGLAAEFWLGSFSRAPRRRFHWVASPDIIRGLWLAGELAKEARQDRMVRQVSRE